MSPITFGDVHAPRLTGTRASAMPACAQIRASSVEAIGTVVASQV